ncbi:MAG: heparinase II/III family protein [Planctomycetota bacterium]|nr:heparinase II/III family protein [Planctomycetota bacterium]
MLVLAVPLAAAPFPSVERYDAFEPGALLKAVNGAVEPAKDDRGCSLRWKPDAGQTAELGLNPSHPLFSRLRYYDRLQFDFRVVGGELDSFGLWGLGHVSGIRQYKVHQYTLAIHSTPVGVWHHRDIELARPNWFPWDLPDGEGNEGYFRFQAMAVAPGTVIELRNIRLVRNVIYVKPFYETPQTWPVKTENPDGSITYTMTYQALNTSGRPTEITAKVESKNTKFKVAITPGSAPTKSAATTSFVLTATMPRESVASLPELDEEPLRVTFAAASDPNASVTVESVLVRPLSKTLRRQVIVPEADLATIRARLKAAIAAESAATQPGAAPAAPVPDIRPVIKYAATIARADALLPIPIYKIPASMNHVRNSLPTDDNGPYEAGRFIPEIVNPKTGYRESNTNLAAVWWKEFMAYGGGAESLGMAYLLTGDEKYAKKGVEHFEVFARQYRELPFVCFFDPPWNAGPTLLMSSRIANNSSYGSNWLLKWHCKMLSMIADSPAWTPEARQRVYNGFVIPYATELIKFPGSISNQTDISNHNLFLLGLVFDDAHILRHALKADPGLLNCVADLDPDGFSSEGRPLNYHFAAMTEYLPTVAYLENSGLKLDYPRERIKSAILMSYQRAALNGLIPNTGDSGRYQMAGNQPLADHLVGMFPDDRWLFDIGGTSTLSKSLRVFEMGKPPKTGWEDLLETNPRVFRTAGMAILREGRSADEQVMVTLDYGRNPFHACLDRNQFCLIAFGKMFTHGPGSLYNVGSGGMTSVNDPRLNTFCTHGSLGHNVVIVDETDQRPAIGKLLAWSPKGDMQFAVSKVEGLQPGVDHTRAVVLANGIVVLLDRVESRAEHTYDLAYHNLGEFSLGEGWKATALNGPLAKTGNYENIVDIRRLTGKGPLRATWDLTNQAASEPLPAAAPARPQAAATNPLPTIRLEFWQPLSPGAEFYAGATGMNNPNTKTVPDTAPSVFQRVKAKSATFATVLEPNKGASLVTNVALDGAGTVTMTFKSGKKMSLSINDLVKLGVAD